MLQILVVDDDELFLRLMVAQLRRRGFEVSTATDGALAMAECARKQPNLVITDLIMPDHEGLELVQRLRSKFSSSKIIAVSGGGKLDGEDYLKLARSFGAHAVLPKPFEFWELFALIEKVTGHAPIPPAAAPLGTEPTSAPHAQSSNPAGS